MKHLPESDSALVLRTDFSDQTAWDDICATIHEPVGELRAYVEFVDDAEYEGVTKEQLLALIPRSSGHSFVIVADRTAMSHPDHPLLVVDSLTEPGREFRTLPSQVQSIENNLSIANMDFDEFAEHVDEHGIFRGFSEF